MIQVIRSRAIRVVYALLFSLGLMIAVPAAAAFKYLSEGMEAPDIAGVDINSGEPISTEAWREGNLVIVAFWSTWSPRSIEELLDLKGILQKYEGRPIKVVAVNVDGAVLTASARQMIETRVREMDLPFPVIIDEELSIFYEFGVIAVPSTAVIGSSGTLKYGPAGYSLTARDRIIDSIEVFLGIKTVDEAAPFLAGYRPNNRASRFYGMALSLANQRSFERALSILDSAQTSDTLFAAPHNLRGEIFLQLKRYDEAAKEYEVAVTRDSMVVAAWSGWGRALLKAGSIDQAMVRIQRALSLDPEYTPAFLDLGFCLLEQGKIEEAVDSLNKARELNLADPMVHYCLGKVYRKAGQMDKAADSFVKALQLMYPSD